MFITPDFIGHPVPSLVIIADFLQINLRIPNFITTFAAANSRWGVCMDVTGEGADILKAFANACF